MDPLAPGFGHVTRFRAFSKHGSAVCSGDRNVDSARRRSALTASTGAAAVYGSGKTVIPITMFHIYGEIRVCICSLVSPSNNKLIWKLTRSSAFSFCRSQYFPHFHGSGTHSMSQRRTSVCPIPFYTFHNIALASLLRSKLRTVWAERIQAAVK